MTQGISKATESKTGFCFKAELFKRSRYWLILHYLPRILRYKQLSLYFPIMNIRCRVSMAQGLRYWAGNGETWVQITTWPRSSLCDLRPVTIPSTNIPHRAVVTLKEGENMYAAPSSLKEGQYKHTLNSYFHILLTIAALATLRNIYKDINLSLFFYFLSNYLN